VTPDPLASVRPAFRSLAVAFVPELGAAGTDTWGVLEQTVADAIGSRPPRMARQLVLFIRVVGAASRLRFGRSLERLDPARRHALLTWFERTPVVALRRGVWGLRTLVLMGYYTQPAVIASLGYRAVAAGWEGRR
jgi:hypothetical protein